jgi:hypothetical protein
MRRPTGVHPLLRVVMDCETHAERLRLPLLKPNQYRRSLLDVAKGRPSLSLAPPVPTRVPEAARVRPQANGEAS